MGAKRLSLLANTSPVTYAIGMTAFVAATLFIASDAIRTLDETRGRLQLVARAIAAELSTLTPDEAGHALLRRVADSEPPMKASLRAPDGRILAMTENVPDASPFVATLLDAGPLFVAEDSAGDVGILKIEQNQLSAFGGVAQRGLAAFGAALFVTTIGYRRRREAARPTRIRLHRYEDFIAAVPFGVACWTPSGELFACNQQYKARLDIEAQDVVQGASYAALVKRLVLGGYMKLVSEDESSRLLELHREDGSCLLIEERPLPHGGFVTLVSDVTERRRTDHLLASVREEQRQLARRYHEEKLRAEAASRSKTSFLAHLSHDIRTPLNHIIGFADLIRHQTYGPIGDPRYLNYVETIKASGELLLSFFSSTLDLAELEGGQKELTPERIDIDALLNDSARRFRGQAARAGVVLAVGGPTEATLLADRFCLDRMIGNLLENALRFTPTGGRVTIAAYAAPDGVVLEVADTGIGMSPERVSALSQPFAFGDATFTKEHSGSGLGLPIARAIAELSGGHLAIDSRPGLGTTVAVSLPLTAPEQLEAIAA